MNLPTDKATMSSLEIAELTGKKHHHLMRDIRNMESAWEKVHKSKFGLMYNIRKLANGGQKKDPYFNLTKTECLYVATKFNDEARAKLILRWEHLEKQNIEQYNQLNTNMAQMANGITQMVKSQEAILSTMNSNSDRIANLENQILNGVKPTKGMVKKLTPEVIDARDQEYSFAKVNGHNVRRIIVNERVYYSINDILQALGVRTSSYQTAKMLKRNAPHTVAKIHIFGNTHPAWFCTKHGIDLIQSGSRKLNGKKVNCELI